MNKKEYQTYLRSAEWLKKKSEFIQIYEKKGWEVHCAICKKENSLQVHHTSYANVGNEQIHDERIWELEILCSFCHTRWHSDKKFKESVEKERQQNFFESLKQTL